MSLVFYDHLLDFSDLEKAIKKHVDDPKDREELFEIIDQITHHRVVGSILDRLPAVHHDEFLARVSQKPHDQSIFSYLTERIAEDVTTFIRHEVYVLGRELLLLVAPDEDKK